MKKLRITAWIVIACLAFSSCGMAGAAERVTSSGNVSADATGQGDLPAEGISESYVMPEEYIVDEQPSLAGGSGSTSGTSWDKGGNYTGTISVTENKASGSKVFSSGGSTIDVSNASKGYVMVKQTGESKRLKVQIVMGDKKYNYDLNNNGSFEAFPLQMGEGTYQIRILKNKEGSTYAEVYSAKIDVKFDSANSPFLCPSQYVNYSSSSSAVKKSFDLSMNAKSDVDKLKSIYGWITENIAYDTNKAKTVQTGYLPNVDSTLSSKTGICFDYAALMACMLRAQGIPAKLICGTVSPKDVNHAWNEVYLKDVGWVTVKVYFEGSDWERMDATFGASGGTNIEDFIGNGSNYTSLRVY